MASKRGVNVLSKAVYIVAAKRTPCGAFGGSFKDLTATQLATVATKDALASGNVDPSLIDTIHVGNVQQTSTDASYMARHIGLHAGCNIETPALTLNRLCGSGFEAVAQAARDIVLGEAGVSLAGGAENMSQAPYAVRNIRFGTKLGTSPQMEDTLWAGLTDQYCNTPMGVTAENLAEDYAITRDDCDAFALRSQQLWGKAHEAGIFSREMAPVEVQKRRKTVVVDTDEHPRPETRLEDLAKLPTVFKKSGVVTAGGSSGICDGGAALILADEDSVKAHGLTPLARVVGYSTAGVPPTHMGIGPVPATEKLLAAAGRTIADVDQVEINEAFGAQCLAVAKALNIDHSKLNIHGGAIAIGHPLGMSGARILTHLAHCLANDDNTKLALGTACIGGGQGIAVLLEKA
ncbi:uncharacterized protein MONBRDRAFT_38241 [Monosiga brevicollis MX1]|uniref:Uncharacterized protein n=1 Tax=Monosiga brevicollis TaxID=81824 RepID=A9V6N5_MONBE|nr:uncharacterized protein MONBRDRAFT_38241 [Monosiga brevicollis MX1]EDQ86765.1 predicted protein [Monosiga brevicollis MX1]|eukprot:XP_001748310.1 hypothetical protein [Monosiga brevicollis MX1]